MSFFVCNHTSASNNFICLSSLGKILAESFQFDWKENIFYKLEKYIQPDCITTTQPSETELLKCHDREKRSFTQLKPESTTRRITEKIYLQHFSKQKLELKQNIFSKNRFIFTASQSWNNTEFLQGSFHTHCTER